MLLILYLFIYLVLRNIACGGPNSSVTGFNVSSMSFDVGIVIVTRSTVAFEYTSNTLAMQCNAIDQLLFRANA